VPVRDRDGTRDDGCDGMTVTESSSSS